MSVIEIKVPAEVLLLLDMDRNNFEKYVMKVLALDLYKNKKYL